MMEETNLEKRLKGCSLFVFILVICFIFYLSVLLPWQTKHGYNRNGAMDKWSHAMNAGNGRSAIFWAKKAASYSSSMCKYIEYHQLALAHELDGQYDIAICYYTLYNHEHKGFGIGVFYPQIFYLQGKTKEAFEAYCAMASAYADTGGIARYNFPKYVTGYPYFSEHPFKDYKDFLVFMEEEYKNLGSPAEYAEFMKFFRSIGGLDIDEPRTSGDRDKIDKMWETIRQKQDQTKE